MICSYCYKRKNHRNVINVGHWWNNEPSLAVVCSERCKDKLYRMLQNNTWMDHKPKAIFGTK